MNLVLKKPELGRYIDEQVRSGRFPTAEAVVEDALSRVMQAEAALDDAGISSWNAADAQIDRGQGIEFDAFAARMRQKHGIEH